MRVRTCENSMSACFTPCNSISAVGSRSPSQHQALQSWCTLRCMHVDHTLHCSATLKLLVMLIACALLQHMHVLMSGLPGMSMSSGQQAVS